MSNENITALMPGTHFNFKGFEWIVLDNNVDGGVLAIMASAWNNEEYSFDDDGCNNYAKSSLRRKLLDELLPILGEDNLIPHEVDLVADNGDDRYGTVMDRLFILSCDEYRKYRKNVPPLPKWMWTCTPWYIPSAGHGGSVRFVGAAGYLNSGSASYSIIENNRNELDISYLNSGSASYSFGVAPACVFNPGKLKVKNAVVQLVEA